jgi:predicted MFS family arabinose efflux permease
MAAGAAVIGLLAGHTGYPAAFLLTAALVMPALVPALRERAPQTAPATVQPATQE